ncbi:hypothetical protein LINGRAHAP2_LOCUS30471 [Linum grandiflorum]
MRQPAHSSASPARKLPPPSPKDPDDDILSYQETGRGIRSSSCDNQMRQPAHSSRSRSPSPAMKLPPPSFPKGYQDTGRGIRSSSCDKQMRELAHSSQSRSPSPAMKLPPPPFPKVSSRSICSRRSGRRNEVENLNNSTKHFMSPTISAASKVNHPSLKKEGINEHPDDVDDSAFMEEYDMDDPATRPDNIIQRRATEDTRTIQSDDFETGKVGYALVCSRVFVFLLLLMILLLSSACITLMSTDGLHRHSTFYHHHGHYHSLELDSYPVAFLRLIEINNGSPSQDLKVVEPPTATSVNPQPQGDVVEEAGKIMVGHPVTDMHIQQVERYSSTSGNEPMKAAAVEQVSQITNDKGTIALEKGKGEDFSPKANPLVRNWGSDFEDDDNRPSLVPIFVVTAIASVMVVVVLIWCILARKRRSSPIRGRGSPSVQQPLGKNKWVRVTSKARTPSARMK